MAKKKRQPPEPDPTPEQIAAMCEGYQKDWSKKERAKRVIGKPQPVDTQEVATGPRTGLSAINSSAEW